VVPSHPIGSFGGFHIGKEELILWKDKSKQKVRDKRNQRRSRRAERRAAAKKDPFFRRIRVVWHLSLPGLCNKRSSSKNRAVETTRLVRSCSTPFACLRTVSLMEIRWFGRVSCHVTGAPAMELSPLSTPTPSVPRCSWLLYLVWGLLLSYLPTTKLWHISKIICLKFREISEVSNYKCNGNNSKDRRIDICFPRDQG
jgi:hypothetical protein